MTALSTRDALAEGICSAICEGDRPARYPGAKDPRNLVGACYKHQRAADALIAIGAVVDAATLANESLVDAVAQAWYRREQPPFGPVTEWGDLSGIEQWRWRQSVCDNLTALAAALTERAS